MRTRIPLWHKHVRSTRRHAEAAFGARAVVERLALALQASLLVQHSPAPVADAFVASRIAGRRGHTFGSLDVDLAGAAAAVIDRAG